MLEKNGFITSYKTAKGREYPNEVIDLVLKIKDLSHEGLTLAETIEKLKQGSNKFVSEGAYKDLQKEIQELRQHIMVLEQYITRALPSPEKEGSGFWYHIKQAFKSLSGKK